MAVTIKQLLDSIYRRIGTTSADPEYPREQLLTYLNDAIAEAWQDCARLAPDVLLTVGRTLQKTAEPNAYAFAQQSPAIGAVEQIRRVCCNGFELTCVPYADLATRDQYALTGVSTSMLLLSDAGGALVIDYTAASPMVAQDGDEMPAFIPDQFRNVLEYMVVREAMAQGDEAEMPADYRARFEERRDMLWEHWANRSSTVRIRRDRKAGA